MDRTIGGMQRFSGVRALIYPNPHLCMCVVGCRKRGAVHVLRVCVSQHAEVSCFDDVALLYHPLKQCNSIVIAFGLRPTLQQQQACSIRTDAAERSETDEKIGSMEKPL